MTQIVRFVDGVSYTEADQSDFNLNMMRPQGVLPESTLGTLAPSAIGSMNVRISAGEAHVQGFQYKNDANVDVAIGANSSGSSRIDVVVLRLNRSLNTLVLGTVVGTPGAGVPGLTQVAGGNWEFPIANITVPNAAVSIVNGNITDVRVYSQRQLLAANFMMATDVNNVGQTVNVWNSMVPAVTTFNVTKNGSIVDIDVQGFISTVNGGGSNTPTGWRLLIDGVTAYQMGGALSRAGFALDNILQGGSTLHISGLSVGSHTVQWQFRPEQAGISLYCRPVTNVLEFLRIQVIENVA